MMALGFSVCGRVSVLELGRRAQSARLCRRKSMRVQCSESANEVFKVVVEAAEDAAKYMMERVGAEVEKTKINSRDLLTEVDPACQKIIEGYMEKYFPEHGIVGEESVASGREASIQAIDAGLKAHEWLWIVDPIDGTTNFVHGQPMSGVSIGVAYKGEPIIGVIVDPYREETFTAIKGAGAYLNGQKIHVSAEQSRKEALVGVGSPTVTDCIDAVLRGTVLMMPEVRAMRMLGSAAVMFSWVACGRLTAYWEPELHSWDSAAGALLVQEAGGRVSDFSGNDFTLRTRPILATNLWTHEPLRELLLAANVHILQ